MAAIPKPDGLIEAIDRAFVAQDRAPSKRLGASTLGKECERAGWYGFRWAILENKFDGRMLRLFDRGQREEAWFGHLLELAGCKVQLHDADGNQFRFFEPDMGGHLTGLIDGIVSGLPEAPGTYHVVEFKTHSEKSFKTLCKEGVAKAKPEHYSQMQLYMRWTDLDRALYLAVNKNDDSLYAERVAYDKDHAHRLVVTAWKILEANRPPPKLSDDPAFFKCKFCDFHAVCHMGALPSVSCRTCLHSTPVVDDSADAKWHCAKWDGAVPHDEAIKPQPCHRYIPDLIPWARAVDATDDGDDGDVIYEIEAGRGFINGESPALPGDAKPYSSTELRTADPALIGEPVAEEMRAKLDGKFVQAPGQEPAMVGEFDDDEVPF